MLNPLRKSSLKSAVRSGLVLLTCCLSLLLVMMDTTIVNVAMPTIGRDLHASTTGLQWIIDAYTIVLASLLMAAGSLGDRLGRRRVFRFGLGLFCAGSLLCSLAPTVGWLIAFRIVQALGGAILNPVALSIVVNTFIEPKARARAVGLWTATGGVALAVGPLAGGLLTHTIGWRSVFWINGPIAIGAIVLASLFLPDSRVARPRRIDPVGQALVMVTLGALIGGLIEGPRLGWGSGVIVGLFALSAVSLLGLLAYEPRRVDPLMELRFFHSVPFTGSILIAVCAFVAFGSFLFLTSLYLQESRGLSAFNAGLCTLPLAVGSALASPLSGHAVAAWGTRPALLMSGCCFIVSAMMLTPLTQTTPLPFLLLAYSIFGIGFGSVNAPISHTAISGMPREQAGVAAAINSASRQIGLAVGVAVAGILLGGANGVQPALLPQATHPAWWLVGGCGVGILAMAMVCTSSWGMETTRHVSYLFAREGE
jgi:EmrB/QacA subfamily drug resistance transporter